MRLILVSILYLCSLIAFADNLPNAVNTILEKHKVQKDDLSLVIERLGSHTPVATLNANTPRTPASVTKLLTTSAALIQMGGNYRWKTQFYVDQKPDANGVVHGNLYVKGGGDPQLVEERLTAMLMDLQQRGIKHITGDIVLDPSMYYLPSDEETRSEFDGHPWSAYNAVPSPLMVNFRTIKVNIEPVGRNGVSISLWPHIANWKIDNQLKVSHLACKNHYSPGVAMERDANGYATVTVKGLYSTACGDRSVTVVMGKATEQFYYLFHDIWYQLGGTFDGVGKVAMVPPKAILFYTGYSLPLTDQIRTMNQLSNNVMTRDLMMTLGVHLYGAPGTLEKGRKAVLSTLTAFGIPTQDIHVDNGCGLSRETHLSVNDLVLLLQNMYDSNFRDDFLQSLAIAGEKGTLKRRFRGSVMQGKVIGKTGTMQNVHSLAAIVTTKAGDKYAVVMIGNGKTSIRSYFAQNDILKWVYYQL